MTDPDGQLDGAAEGGMRFQISESGGKLVVIFGSPVTSIAMPPEQAVALAETLIFKAKVMARRAGKTLTVRIL